MAAEWQLASTDGTDLSERQRLIARLQGFAELGPSAAAYKGHAGEVAACLASPDAKVRETACAVLAELGEAGVPYVGEVLKLLDIYERDPGVRKQALRALGACGGGLARSKDVSAALDYELKKQEMQALALRTVGELGLAEEFSFQIERLVASPLPSVRAAALSALGSLGPKAGQHVRLVSARLSEPVLREEALYVLAHLGAPAAEHLTEIADFLRDSDPAVRGAAAEALQSLGRFAGSQNERTVRKALELLELKDEGLKAAGISALGFLGESLAGDHAQQISHFLTRVPPPPQPLAQEQPVARKAEVSVPYSHFDHYMIAVFGLPPQAPKKMEAEVMELPAPAEEPPEPGPAILRKASCAAALALARLGKSGHAFAGQLAKLCSSPDPELRLACLEALGDMGSRGQLHAQAVLAQFRDPEPAVRAAAVATLGRMAQLGASLDEQCVRQMGGMLADGDHNVRCAAALALADAGGPCALLASAKVAQLLRRQQEEAVLAGLQALGTLGSLGAVVVTFSVSGLDYSFMRGIKPILEAFLESVKQVLSAEAKGAEVHLECTAAESTGANVKAAIMQSSAEEASALQASMDAQRLEGSLSRTIASVPDITRVFIGGEIRASGAVVACQAAVHAEAVAKLLEDASPGVRCACLQSLAAMRGGGPSLAPNFVGRAAARLEDEECDVRIAAALALAEMGQAGVAQASDVSRLLQDPFSAVRCAACQALSRMAQGGTQLPSGAVDALEAVAGDGGFHSVQEAASEALKLIKG